MKNDFFPALILMVLMTLMTAFGQILLKIGVTRQKRPVSPVSWFRFFCYPPILGGVLLALSAPVIYLKALSYLSLGELYSLNGLGYFFVYLLSRLILKEKGSWLHWAGLCCIALGIILWAGGGIFG